MSDLFFDLSRISVLQILRSVGIDKASPDVIDVVTDLLTAFLERIAKDAVAYANICGRAEPDISDARFAMEQLGLLKPQVIVDPLPRDYTSDLRNMYLYELIPGTTTDIDVVFKQAADEAEDSEAVNKFAVWANSTQFSEIRRVANYANQPFAGRLASSGALDAQPPVDWLEDLIKRHIRVGQETKFLDTVLSSRLRPIDSSIMSDVATALGPDGDNKHKGRP
ncbi:hypothetical protein CANCADRAFT_133436 [Tortispora caseinolytica NRRL Y-17796]|uniref:Bromodomain associated domain-containing protein n=1 Tax=Tortispora caseinolytica NRRL Y-17796 TaxID=767744 RepID=A0A1E4TBF8_9ASCO|nr:hypothetical protein CANCADRAFT_133436 [Tortispora caseinolytica NRRL Y-17796]